MARRNSDSGRQAVIWLATAFVVVIGAAASAFVIIAGAEETRQPFLVWGLCFTGLAVVLLLVNLRWDRPVNRLHVWLFAQNRDDPTDHYRAARRRIEAREKYGTNQPPSVDTVREASEHNGTWAPRSTGNSVPRRRQ